MSKSMMTESELKNLIVGFLRLWNWVVIKMPPSIYTSGKGIPDLYIAKDGKSFWIEIKTPRGKLSISQAGFRDLMRKAGIEWYLVMSLEDIIKITGEKCEVS